MKTTMRIVLCFFLCGFLSACGGGGGGSAFVSTGDDNPMMDSGGILPEGLQPVNGLGLAAGIEEEVLNPVAALAEIDARQFVFPGELSFYEQIATSSLEVTDGNAGPYHLVLRTAERDADNPIVIRNRRFLRVVDTFAVYSHIVLGWGSRVAEDGMNFLNAQIVARYPSPPLPISGEATYALEGRGYLTHWEGNTYDSPNEIYEVVMTGEMTADFGGGIVSGRLASDYGYRIAPLAAPIPGRQLTRITEDITAAKYLGNDRRTVPSELNGGVELLFGDSYVDRFGTTGSYMNGSIFVGEAGEENLLGITVGYDGCGTRDCFLADLYATHAGTSGDFDRLTSAHNYDITTSSFQVTPTSGNRIGFVGGRFAGPNHEQVIGHFLVQNVPENILGNSNDMIRNGEPHPITLLEGFFAGTKQPESE